jgi:hypothetical protein
MEMENVGTYTNKRKHLFENMIMALNTFIGNGSNLWAFFHARIFEFWWMMTENERSGAFGSASFDLENGSAWKRNNSVQKRFWIWIPRVECVAYGQWILIAAVEK